MKPTGLTGPVPKPAIMPWVSGVYYDGGAQWGLGGPSGVALAADTLYSALLWVPEDGGAIDRIGIVVTATGTATLARLGVHLLGADNRPGPLLFDAGVVDISTTGDKEIAVSRQLPPGELVVPVMIFNGSVSVHIYASPLVAPLGWATAGATTRRVSWSKPATPYGPLADPFPSSPGALQSMPRIQVRAA